MLIIYKDFVSQIEIIDILRINLKNENDKIKKFHTKSLDDGKQ